MKTVIYPPPGVYGFGRYRTAAVVARPLTLDAAEQVVTDLALRDIYVAATLGRRVELRPLATLTTEQEVAALRAFRAVTDSPLAWQGVRRAES